MKLPEKKYEPKHNRELKDYAQGWNYCLKEIERLCDEYDDEYAKESLLRRKEVALKKRNTPFYEGAYDCIVEIEKLNEEPEHRLDNFFQDSLEALDKLNIRGEQKKALLVIDEPSVCSEYGLYAKAIETYGDTLQKVVAIEELSELIKEICKDLRNNGNKKAIIEEIVDVQIMINQLFIIYGINQDEFESEYQRKLERLEKRINER